MSRPRWSVPSAWAALDPARVRIKTCRAGSRSRAAGSAATTSTGPSSPNPTMHPTGRRRARIAATPEADRAAASDSPLRRAKRMSSLAAISATASCITREETAPSASPGGRAG